MAEIPLQILIVLGIAGSLFTFFCYCIIRYLCLRLRNRPKIHDREQKLILHDNNDLIDNDDNLKVNHNENKNMQNNKKQKLDDLYHDLLQREYVQQMNGEKANEANEANEGKDIGQQLLNKEKNKVEIYEIIKKDWLSCKSTKNKSYKKKYFFELTSAKMLIYYKNKNDTYSKGTINLKYGANIRKQGIN